MKSSILKISIIVFTLINYGFSSHSVKKDLLSTFNTLNGNTPQDFTLIHADTSMHLPVGHDKSFYHQQGIQKLENGGFAISGSAKNNGYIYLTDSSLQITTVITPEFRNPENENYNHLGGFQVAENILAIGLERLESRAKGTSVILFYDVSDIKHPVFLEHLSIARIAAGTQTAGAVALARMNDHWIVLVANWDAARVDMYRSNQVDLLKPSTRFDQKPVISWESDSGLDKKSIDQEWGNYQNINLFNPDEKGELWMVGTHTQRVGIQNQNWADLYQVQFFSDKMTLSKKSKKQFLTDDMLFKNGAGFFYDKESNTFEVYACERNMGEEGVSRCSRWVTRK